MGIENIKDVMEDDDDFLETEETELDDIFAPIQKIFADRYEEKREREVFNAVNNKNSKSQERQPELKLIQTSRKAPLRSETKYENMRAKNIKATNESTKLLRKATAVLVAGAIVIGGIVVWGNHKREEIEREKYSYSDASFSSDIISPEECDLSNFIVVLRESTDNVNEMSSTINKELTTLGVESKVLKLNDNMTRELKELKNENPEKDIIVINLDGKINKSSIDTIVMTTYRNDVRSADTIALAIHNANEDIYGITSDIRCGKSSVQGGSREETSVEKELFSSGIKDITCLTVAPNSSYLTSDTNVNNLSTSIAESIIRFAALSEENRYQDIIRRVEVGDTISELAEENGVSQSYIRSSNSEILATNNGFLPCGEAIIVMPINKVLTSDVEVENKAITTDSNDIKTVSSYYVVQENDTVSEIAEKLNIPQDELIVPSGNVDKINIGDKIGYTTTSGPILVTKTSQKAK